MVESVQQSVLTFQWANRKKRYYGQTSKNKLEQAGGELCQAQEKLGLTKPALPRKKLLL